MTRRQLAAALALALAVPAFAANKSDVKVFDIGQEATAIAVTADGSAVWFVGAWSERLGRFDTATGAVRTWPTPAWSPDYYSGAQPYDVVIDDFGDVWFNELPGRAGRGPAFVTRFKPATETFEQFVVNPAWWNGYGGSIWLGQGGLSKGFDGKIWFSDNSAVPVVGSIDPATGVVASWTTGFWPGYHVASDLAVSSTGKILVSLWGRTEVDQGLASVDPVTGAATRLPAFTTASSGTADSFGNAWFNASGPESGRSWPVLARIADDGTVTWFPEFSTETMPGYRGQVAADALGHVWIPYDDWSSGANDLAELDPWTGTLTRYDFPFKPEFVSFAGNGQMVVSQSNVGGGGLIALVLDLDKDGDGVMGKQDCDDRDPGAFPGAPEVKLDGKDQDCNGYDLTIQVTKATHKAGAGLLRVEATSALGAGAALQLTGFGPMKWDALTSRWVLSVTTAKTNPGTVTVCGLEGCDLPVAVTAL